MITPSYGLTATERVLPNMALDFTTATLDPRVTFTRTGNTATVINSSGLVAPINADLPRFDFNPTTLVCKGLLIEEASTNLLTYSENQSNAVWNINTNMGVAASATTDPAGGTNAFTLTANANSALFGRTLTGTIGQPYTYSIWIRRKTGTGGVRMFIGDNISQIVTSQVSSTWNRISVSNTPTAVTVRAYIQLDISGNEIEIYGAQVEQKAFSTSYIPTVASQVTRNADVATMTGTNLTSWYVANEGTFSATGSTNDGTASKALLSVDDTTLQNRMTMRRANNSFGCIGVTLNVTQWNNNTAANSWPNSTTKTATLGYKVNDIGFALAGTDLKTDLIADIPAITILRIGGEVGGNIMNGYVQKIFYWPFKLTNSEITAFSK